MTPTNRPVLLGLRRGVFTCVGWQVTLCDPIRQVTLRSCEMELHYLYVLLFNIQKGLSPYRHKWGMTTVAGYSHIVTPGSSSSIGISRYTVILDLHASISQPLHPSRSLSLFSRISACPSSPAQTHKQTDTRTYRQTDLVMGRSHRNTTTVRLQYAHAQLTRKLCHRKDDRAMRSTCVLKIVCKSTISRRSRKNLYHYCKHHQFVYIRLLHYRPLLNMYVKANLELEYVTLTLGVGGWPSEGVRLILYCPCN